MALLPVSDALSLLLDGADTIGEEIVPINKAFDRFLSQDLASRRTHPPFPASAMDGYAVRYEDAKIAGAELKIIGESAAGKGFDGAIGKGETVRIFTGAPVPRAADTVLIQENANRISDDLVEVTEAAQQNRHIRVAGVDFNEGDVLLKQHRKLDYSAITLAASMNYDKIPVFKKPLVGVLATGNELVLPGEVPGRDQIIASNSFGVMGLCGAAGSEILDLGIAIDQLDAIKSRVQTAIDENCEVLVTIGGASVGDHDLVQQALTEMGMELEFWKIAMRPGKPLMSGRLGNMRIVGLPGNPASSLVTANLFLAPLLRRLAGNLNAIPKQQKAKAAIELAANDHRQDYLRATIERDGNGELVATPFLRQDSSLVRVFADANGLLIRPPGAPEAKIGDICDVLLFDQK